MATDVAMGGTDELELPLRKKPKVSELPLSSVQRASIDGLLYTFKKKGEFDVLRKKAFQQYNESAQRGMFESALRDFTSTEIDRDSFKYLKPDRRIAAPLLEGAAARANTYTTTEEVVDALIDQYVVAAERALREIRRQEIGDEAAQEEFIGGSKSDEAYAAEADERRLEREKKFAETEKLRKKKEAQDRKKKELEALLKKQEELKKETEKLQRDQQRRAEREAWKLAEKERDRERIRKFNEDRERLKQEAAEREQKIKEEQERRQKERADRESKRLEEDALNELIREGQRMAEKTKRPELERSESMEPPSRLLKHMFPPHNAMSRDEMRSVGLMPTSLTLKRAINPPSAPPQGTPGREKDKPRSSRPRSPSITRSKERRLRHDASPREDERRTLRRETSRRRSLYRDISAEREAWKARQRDRSVHKGEEGEVVERTPAKARSKSRESHRRRRDSRSPPRRNYRDRSRSRSPPRRLRERDFSPAGRRERSRSPPGIDRYVPGGTVARRTRESDERPTRRLRDDDRGARRTRDDEDDRASRRPRDDDEDRDRRKSTRYDDRPKPMDIDRYIPGSGARPDDSERGGKRRDRSGSRTRVRDRDRDRERDRDRDRDRRRESDSGRGKDRNKEPERERNRDRARDRDHDRGRGRDRDRDKDQEKGKVQNEDREA